MGWPPGVVLDLHWSLVHHADVRARFHLPTEQLIARGRDVRVLGHPVPTLDESDTLVHVATHAAISGGHRLVWLADLDAAIRRLDGVPDAGWDGLVQRARDAGAGLVLAVMLDRSRRALGTPLPAGLLASLSAGGRLWLGLTGAFDALRPVSRSVPPELSRAAAGAGHRSDDRGQPGGAAAAGRGRSGVQAWRS